MIDEMRRHLVRDFPPGGFERAGNTKTHGLVRGELIIRDDLPDAFRHGLFAAPKTYPCWVRFSGPGPHVEPDIDDVGFVSISVKVMGVEGEKLWDDEKHTQDFTSVCTPTFVTPDIKSNARLQYWSRRHMPSWYFLNFREPHLLDMMMQGLWNETQTNPLGATFYSCVPYLIGPGQAMQYSFWPKTEVYRQIPRLPLRPPDNYLRDNMIRTLDEMGVEFRNAWRRSAADRPVSDADRKQCGAVAGAAVAAGSGRDVTNSATEVRRSGAVRLYPQSEIQSLALPGGSPAARQSEPRPQAHV